MAMTRVVKGVTRLSATLFVSRVLIANGMSTTLSKSQERALATTPDAKVAVMQLAIVSLPRVQIVGGRAPC